VSPEICSLDFLQMMAILDGFAARGASSAIADVDADAAKTASARTILILSFCLKREKNNISGN
jgi:hypothetical protein